MLAFQRSQVCLVSLPWIATGSDAAAIDQDHAEPFGTRSQPGPSLQPAQQGTAASDSAPTIPLPGSSCGPQPFKTHLAAQRCVVIAELSSPSHPRIFSRVALSLLRLLPHGSTLQSTNKVGTQENLGSPKSTYISPSNLDLKTWQHYIELWFSLLGVILLHHWWVFKVS